MHILDDRGDLLEGLSLHTLTWIRVLDKLAGITGGK